MALSTLNLVNYTVLVVYTRAMQAFWYQQSRECSEGIPGICQGRSSSRFMTMICAAASLLVGYYNRIPARSGHEHFSAGSESKATD